MCTKCKELESQGPRFCVLKIHTKPTGSTMPITSVIRDGKKVYYEYEIEKTLGTNKDEAKKYALEYRLEFIDFE